MMPADWTQVLFSALLIAVLVGLSALYAGSEPILFSLTRAQLERAAASSNRLRRLAATVMQQPQRTLSIILLGNTAVNVLLYASTYVLFDRLQPYLGAVLSNVLPAAFSLLVVSIFCEAFPKTIGVSMADRLAPVAAGVVHFSGYVLGPLSRALDLLLLEPLTRLLLGRPHTHPEATRDLTPAELKAMLEMSRRQGMIDPLEDAFLREIVDLGTLKVRDVMVPRVEVQVYDVNGSPDGLRELIRQARRKKIPVYSGTLDNIVGLVYAKVLFLQNVRSLREIVQPVRFVPELSTCEQLLHHFRQTRTQVAIAVDEYGGMAGLVTLEDVLEAIVGDIETEQRGLEEPEVEQVGEEEFEISGQLHVRYWADWFGVPRLEEHVATVGGLMTARLGRPARVGDTVRFGAVELRAVRVGGRRVERLRVRLLASGDGEAASGEERRA